MWTIAIIMYVQYVVAGLQGAPDVACVLPVHYAVALALWVGDGLWLRSGFQFFLPPSDVVWVALSFPVIVTVFASRGGCAVYVIFFFMRLFRKLIRRLFV